MLFLSGDPALDYIGTGGAEYLPEDSVIPGMYQLVFGCFSLGKNGLIAFNL